MFTYSGQGKTFTPTFTVNSTPWIIHWHVETTRQLPFYVWVYEAETNRGVYSPDWTVPRGPSDGQILVHLSARSYYFWIEAGADIEAKWTVWVTEGAQ